MPKPFKARLRIFLCTCALSLCATTSHSSEKIELQDAFLALHKEQPLYALREYAEHLIQADKSGNSDASVYLARLYLENLAILPKDTSKALAFAEKAIKNKDSDGYLYRCVASGEIESWGKSRRMLDCFKDAFKVHGSIAAAEPYAYAIQNLDFEPTAEERQEALVFFDENVPKSRRFTKHVAALMAKDKWIKPWPGLAGFLRQVEEWNLPRRWIFGTLRSRYADSNYGLYAYFNAAYSNEIGAYKMMAGQRIGYSSICSNMSQDVYEVTTETLHVRSSPSTNGKSVNQLHAGEKVCSYRQPNAEGWMAVTSIDRPIGGWVYRKYLEGPAAKLFDVSLQFAHKEWLVRVAKKAGGIPTQTDSKYFYHLLDATKLMRGASSLAIGQAQDFDSGYSSNVAHVYYEFPSTADADQIIQIRDLVSSKYGTPHKHTGNPSVGPVSYEWNKVGITISVNRGLPDTTTYLEYRVDDRYAQLQKEIKIAAESRTAKHVTSSNF